MNFTFPYLRLVASPFDLWPFVLLRLLQSPAVMSTRPLRGWLQNHGYLVVRPKLLDGKSLILSVKDTSQTVVFNEIFIDKIYDLNRIPFVPSHVFDCGANVGMFSLLAYSKFPAASFRLFEPNPINLKQLKQTLEKNRLHLEICEGAVSDHNGSLDFDENFSAGGQITSQHGCESYSVPCVDLPQLLRETSPTSLLLKMDIEGYEMEIFDPVLGSLPKRAAIFLETHGGEEDWQVLANKMAGCGFSVSVTRKRGLYVDGYAFRL